MKILINKQNAYFLRLNLENEEVKISLKYYWVFCRD